MKRHTRWTLLLGAAIACIGMAGLHRVAKRTAYRYRLMAPVLKHARYAEDAADVTELANFRSKRAA